MWGGVCGQGCKDLSLPCGHLKGTGTGHRLHVAGTAGKQRAPEHGIRGGGARPWDGHSSSFLSRNQQAGWGARKAFQPTGKLTINSHGPGDVPGGTCHLWPAAACHHCAAASCWAAGWGTRRSRPACGPARTALARRRPHVGARSPQHPGSSSRLPSLSACQPTFPTRFLPLSFFCIFFFLLLFSSLPVTMQGGRRGASSEWAARGDGRRGVIGLESSGCSPHCHSRFQRSHFLPSPGSLFLPTKEERTVSTAAAVPQIASQSCCPEQRSAAECYAILSLPLLGPPGRVVALRAGLSGSGIGVSGKLSRRLCKAWCWLVVCLSFFLSLTFPPKKLSS